MAEVRYPWTREAAACAASGHAWPSRAPAVEAQTGGVWPLFIGLQIVLFACFLALVGLSIDKAGPVTPVDPIADADNAPAPVESPATVAADPAPTTPFALSLATSGAASESAAHTAAAAAFDALLRLLAPQQPPSTDALRIEITAEQLFVEDRAILQPAGRAAAEQIAAALAEPMDDVPLAASLLLVATVPTGASTANDPADGAADGTADGTADPATVTNAEAEAGLARRRCVAFLQAVLAEGAPADSFAVGVGDGTPGSAVLSWQLKPIETPEEAAAAGDTRRNGIGRISR